MNCGVLGVTLKLTDFDGDAVSYTRDISGTVSIDDDGPHATCDYYFVTEGKGNTATGNVVSGASPENPDLGTDANGTDGNADQLSQDTPHTISKLTHGGHAYTLSADGLTVLKDGLPLGAGESFAGGKLTITTEERRDLRDHHGQRRSGRRRRIQIHQRSEPDPCRGRVCRSGRHRCFAQFGVRHRGRVAERLHDRRHQPGRQWRQPGDQEHRRQSEGRLRRGPRTIAASASTPASTVRKSTLRARTSTLESSAVKFPGGVNNAEVLIGALFNGVQFDAGHQGDPEVGGL